MPVQPWTVIQPTPADPNGGFYLALKETPESDTQVLFYAKKWTPPSGKFKKPKATITFVHGIGEHILRYDDMFNYFANLGISVFAYDQRGSGRTLHLNNGTKEFTRTAGSSTTAIVGSKSMGMGDGGEWQSVLEDVYRANQFNKECGHRVAGVAHFLMGHSMGGLIVSHFSMQELNKPDVQEELKIAGVIASAPAFRASRSVPWLKRTVGGWLSNILGTFNIPTDLDVTAISRDPKVVEVYKADPYVHGMVSLRTAAAILGKGDWCVDEGYRSFPKDLPYLIAFGTADRIAILDHAKELFDKLKESQPEGDFELKIWIGLFHELHNEQEKNEVYKCYSDWILKHI